MAKTDQVIANALAEVAASKALRERALARRAEMQKRVDDAPRSLYVLSRKGTQMELSLQ